MPPKEDAQIIAASIGRTISVRHRERIGWVWVAHTDPDNFGPDDFGSARTERAAWVAAGERVMEVAQEAE